MIQITDLYVRQGSFELQGINLQLPQQAYGVVMGPTGSGKTTLLEAICGLRRPSRGRIEIGGKQVTDWPPAQRRIGYVPQEGALFPGMRVDRQIAFALRARRVSRQQQRQRVLELARLLDCQELLERYPGGLSGGEQQRVALARALAFGPQLLCLDEPLSALDATARESMVDLLAQVVASQPITVIHITHNVLEGDRLGTHRFQMNAGRLEQVSGPMMRS